MTNANVIIPTKSNFSDLFVLLENLDRDPRVERIIVVADGEKAYNTLKETLPADVTLFTVPLASGIHKMWNMGMDELKGSGLHLAIVNDDVALTENAISTVCDLLDRRADIGLANPSGDASENREFIDNGRFGGCCMILAKDLVEEWRFDERMMWWYGDTDVMKWVHDVKKRRVGYTGLCHALNNRSATIVNDSPPNFHDHIRNDQRIFEEKWS